MFGGIIEQAGIAPNAGMKEALLETIWDIECTFILCAHLDLNLAFCLFVQCLLLLCGEDHNRGVYDCHRDSADKLKRHPSFQDESPVVAHLTEGRGQTGVRCQLGMWLLP